MRCVTYAGESVITTDEVAEALVTLTASLAKHGDAEAVRIPIVLEDTGAPAEAELVIGVGNDVLSAPVEWDGEAPDFAEAVADLRAHRLFPPAPGESRTDDVQDLSEAAHYDWEFDQIDRL